MKTTRLSALVVLLIGAALATTGCAATDESEATDDPTVTTEPTTSAPVQDYTIFGDLPVTHHDAIPWDDVGPGWFVLGFDPDFQRFYPNPEESVDLIPILVSPNGEMFATDRDHPDLLHTLESWFSDEVFGSGGPRDSYARDVRFNLETGELYKSSLFGVGAPMQGAADGHVLGYRIEGNDPPYTTIYAMYDVVANERVVNLCTTDAESRISPLASDGRRVVCFVETDQDTTSAVLDGIDIERVELFQFPRAYTDYTPRGWVGENSLLVSVSIDWEDGFFILDTETGAVTPTADPFGSDEMLFVDSFWTYYPELEAYIVHVEYGSGPVLVFGKDGFLISRVECSVSCSVAHSGGSVLIADPKSAGSLDEGSTQGLGIVLVDVPSRRIIEVFDGELSVGGFAEGVYGHPEAYH